VDVTMPRATWVTTSGTTNAHPPALNATPIAAFMNSPSTIAGEDGDLGLPAGDVEVRRFKGGEEPHGKTAQRSTRVSAAPRQVRSSTRCSESCETAKTKTRS
jgi:hypothetical protein